jgi:sugar O-acyltransferase (sialic acid O-acetyltransferase NeuD family)
MKKKLVIFPAAGHGREILWLIRDLIKAGEKIEPVGFLDDSPKLHGRNLCGLPVLGGLEWLDGKTSRIQLVLATGFPRLKKKFAARAAKMNAGFATLIHPEVQRSQYVEIGEGSIICAGSILTTQVRLGRFVLVNIACTVSHDVEVGDYSSLAPGTHLTGGVKLGTGVDIGAGVSIIPGVRVGDWTVVGAGAAVVDDLPARVKAAGVPARPFKKISPAA